MAHRCQNAASQSALPVDTVSRSIRSTVYRIRLERPPAANGDNEIVKIHVARDRCDESHSGVSLNAACIVRFRGEAWALRPVRRVVFAPHQPQPHI
jgi:hypothetical protein